MSAANVTGWGILFAMLAGGFALMADYAGWREAVMCSAIIVAVVTIIGVSTYLVALP